MRHLLRSRKANAEDVENFYRKLFDRFDVYASPAQTPDPQLGMNVYRDHCATCHGKNADGKSELAHAKIFQKSRPPTDFTDASFLIRSTPFRIYNVLLQGIPNTAKAAYATRLTDHQMWSVSFVLQGISSLRTLATFEKCRSDARLKDKIMVTSAKDFSLQQLATSSDSVLLNFFGPNDPNTRLGVARCRAPFDSTTRR